MGSRNKTRVVNIDRYRGEATIKLSVEDLSNSVWHLRMISGSTIYTITWDGKVTTMKFPFSEYQEKWFKYMKYKVNEI